LIENLVVLAIFSALLVLTVSSLQKFAQLRRLDGQAAEIVTDIQYARGDAVACNKQIRLSFHMDAHGSCYLLHTGPRSGCSCSSSGSSQCTDAAAVILKTIGLPVSNGVRLEANVTSFLFDAGRGTVTPTGSVILTAANGHSIRQVVNIAGRTRTCSPAGQVPGHRPC
jgi:type IV fimbrial biogenesis protein FimT